MPIKEEAEAKKRIGMEMAGLLWLFLAVLGEKGKRESERND